MSTVNNLLVKADCFCDYIPLVSSITNLIDLFQKSVLLPAKEKSTINANHYFKHLEQKSFSRCVILLIPVLGNIIVGIYDFAIKKSSSPIIDHDATPSNMIATLKRLELKDPSPIQFVYQTKKKIEEKKGICLTPCEEKHYSGVVASLENSEYILHLCPGGGYMTFSEGDFSRMMPQVAQALLDKNITPSAFVIDARHPGDLWENFEKWQAS